MKNTLLEIGCDGGSIKIERVLINGIFFFKISSEEMFTKRQNNAYTYLAITEAWNMLKVLYPQWHQLYLVSINSQMIELLKSDYIKVDDKNEYTQDRWLEQLIGKGLGF